MNSPRIKVVCVMIFTPMVASIADFIPPPKFACSFVSFQARYRDKAREHPDSI